MAGREPYDNQVSIQAINSIEIVQESIVLTDIAATIATGGTVNAYIYPPEGYIYRCRSLRVVYNSDATATSGKVYIIIYNGLSVGQLEGSAPTQRVLYQLSEPESYPSYAVAGTKIIPSSNADFIKMFSEQVLDSDIGLRFALKNTTNKTVSLVGSTIDVVFEKERVG